MKIIAADIGGTKSWFCLCEVNSDSQSLTLQSCVHHFEAIYPSANFKNFSELLTHFLQDAQKEGSSEVSASVDAMCLALPGVVQQGHAHLTNLDWELSADQIQADFNIAKVLFVNDFQAAAIGITTLQEKDIVILNNVLDAVYVQKKAVTVVTGAGTGLGLAWMDNTQNPLQLFATEGGHYDFAPTNDEQIKLLKFLQKQYGHVSYERILSGSGLAQLYDFFHSENKIQTNNSMRMTAKKVHELASQENPQAISALRLFVTVYAAHIGNLALLYKPEGGIYIAGGIASHILPWMQKEDFINSYLNKGRMAGLAQKIPVYLVVNKRLGLQGAIQLLLNEFGHNIPHHFFNEGCHHGDRITTTV